MKSAQIFQSKTEAVNNRLVNRPPVSHYQPTNGALFVELMQVLQKAQKQAQEDPKEAELNRTTMRDNNGKRIIYTFVDFA